MFQFAYVNIQFQYWYILADCFEYLYIYNTLCSLSWKTETYVFFLLFLFQLYYLSYLSKKKCIFINTNQFPIELKDVKIFLPRNSWANMCELSQLQWLIFSCSNILHNPTIKMSKAAHKPLVVTLTSVWSKVYNWQFMIGNDFLKVCLQ